MMPPDGSVASVTPISVILALRPEPTLTRPVALPAPWRVFIVKKWSLADFDPR